MKCKHGIATSVVRRDPIYILQRRSLSVHVLLKTKILTTMSSCPISSDLQDIGCDDYLSHAGLIQHALADGAIAMSDLDAAISRQFRVRMRLGEFDPLSNQPYTLIPPSAACSADHVQLARDAARQSITLLSNPKGAVPLTRGPGLASIAVVGPLADNQYINGAWL